MEEEEEEEEEDEEEDVEGKKTGGVEGGGGGQTSSSLSWKPWRWICGVKNGKCLPVLLCTIVFCRAGNSGRHGSECVVLLLLNRSLRH